MDKQTTGLLSFSFWSKPDVRAGHIITAGKLYMKTGNRISCCPEDPSHLIESKTDIVCVANNLGVVYVDDCKLSFSTLLLSCDWFCLHDVLYRLGYCVIISFCWQKFLRKSMKFKTISLIHHSLTFKFADIQKNEIHKTRRPTRIYDCAAFLFFLFLAWGVRQ